jgi:RAP domain
MELAQTSNGLTLPHNFPDGWISSDDTSQSIDSTSSNKLSSSPSSSNLLLITSLLQQSVSRSLKEIGFNHVMEHTISMKEMVDEYFINIPAMDIEIISIDIANVQEKIAIEVDGPYHYVLKIDCIDNCNTNVNVGNDNGQSSVDIEFESNGATMLKRRLLASMGWTVLVVPFWEWHQLDDDRDKEIEYCQRLLNWKHAR